MEILSSSMSMNMSIRMMSKPSVWRSLFAARPFVNSQNARFFLKPTTPWILSPRLASFYTVRRVVGVKSRCSSESDSDTVGHRNTRPETVAWHKELANTVHLIGTICQPVELKNTKAGKTTATTRLVYRTCKSNETIWFTLKFFEELATIAAEHVNLRDQVYVSGSLEFLKADGEDKNLCGTPQVLVNALSFVERSFPQSEDVIASVQNKEAEVKLPSSGKKTTIDASSKENLWQAFFAKSDEWWDNRENKKNPRAPDFKHKGTGEVLWIEDSKNPSWVKSKLATLEERKHEERQGNDADGGMQIVQIGKKTQADAASIEKLWQAFISNPDEWWDNRNNKKNPRAPDFKHKDTGEALWIGDSRNPSWVKSQLEKVDQKMKDSRQSTKSREPLSSFMDRDLTF